MVAVGSINVEVQRIMRFDESDGLWQKSQIGSNIFFTANFSRLRCAIFDENANEKEGKPCYRYE